MSYILQQSVLVGLSAYRVCYCKTTDHMTRKLTSFAKQCLWNGSIGNRQTISSTCRGIVVPMIPRVKDNSCFPSGMYKHMPLRAPHPSQQRWCTSNVPPSEFKKKEKSLYKDLLDAPTPALYLGFAGLIPFLGPALFCLGSMSYSPVLASIQVAYSAIILSFLGGIHWGYSLDNEASPASWNNLGYSGVPAMVAWLGLLITPEFGTLMLMAGLAFAWRRDTKFKSMPAWFRALRICLSVGAILSLGLTYSLGLLFPPPEANTTYNWVKLAKIIKIILED